jgi:hypothetical protein
MHGTDGCVDFCVSFFLHVSNHLVVSHLFAISPINLFFHSLTGLSNSLDSFTTAAAAAPVGSAAFTAAVPSGQHVRAALALLAQTLCVPDASSGSSSSSSSLSSSVASVPPLLLALAHHPLALATAAHPSRHAGAENPSRAPPLFGAMVASHVAAVLAAKVTHNAHNDDTCA